MINDFSIVEQVIKAHIEKSVNPFVVDLFPANPRLYIEQEFKSAVGSVLVQLTSFNQVQTSEGEVGYQFTVNVTVISLDRIAAVEQLGKATTALDSGKMDKQHIVIADRRYVPVVTTGGFNGYDYRESGIWQYNFTLTLTPR